VASVDRTAYPRFKRTTSARELREAFTPDRPRGRGPGRRRRRRDPRGGGRPRRRDPPRHRVAGNALRVPDRQICRVDVPESSRAISSFRAAAPPHPGGISGPVRCPARVKAPGPRTRLGGPPAGLPNGATLPEPSFRRLGYLPRAQRLLRVHQWVEYVGVLVPARLWRRVAARPGSWRSTRYGAAIQTTRTTAPAGRPRRVGSICLPVRWVREAQVVYPRKRSLRHDGIKAPAPAGRLAKDLRQWCVGAHQGLTVLAARPVRYVTYGNDVHLGVWV
jgi:hypothetical protein